MAMSDREAAIEAEIEKLEEEIMELENNVKEQYRQNKLSVAWKDHQSVKTVNDDEDILRAKLESLKNQVDFMRRVTEIGITDVNTTITSEERLKVTKKKGVTGHCGNIVFQLEMTLEESMNLDATVQSKLTHLSISASESVYRDLKDVVEKLAEEGDVQGFLTLLRPYSRWQDARERTFQHFVTAFPDIVQQKNLQTLTLSHPVKNCSFEISWHFKVVDLYNVLPDIQMSVHIPKKVQASSSDLLETVPERFELMLQKLGIERTFNCLIALLAK